MFYPSAKEKKQIEKNVSDSITRLKASYPMRAFPKTVIRMFQSQAPYKFIIEH